MLMLNRAPGLERGFCSQAFPQFSKSLWTDAREEARANIITDSAFEAYASDINPECVKIAEESAKHAGVFKNMKIFQRDALTIKTEGRRGTIVCNPPYGERLMTIRDAEALYRKMGEHFKALDSWQIYVITNHEQFSRFYGRKPDKVRKLSNGNIPCYFYQFFKKFD